MPRFSLPLASFVALAVLAGACVRAPAKPAPVPAAITGAVALGLPAKGATPMSAADTTYGLPPRHSSARGDATTRGDTAVPVSARDLALEAVRLFGDSVAPPPTDTMVSPGAPVWDIDVRSYETRARVGDYVRIFSGRAREIFAIALQRQTRYGPMIRERLRAQGLPEDLTYLALVESWFNPHAYSRAAAVGIWQFMAGTARGMGLKVNWWVDERRDPVRSTEAAARLLLGLRDQFGSLYLAAAAYNGGSGRVSRGLARYAGVLDGVEGDDRFFALAEQSYLRPETRDYVPKIIGAALVGKEPARFGVTVESLPPYSYDSVRVGGGVPLAAVAKGAGVPSEGVAELNPHILRGMTPPNDSMWVRVSPGSASGFAERFASLDPEERRGLRRVESRKGQSMASIARAHDLAAKQLGWFNPKVAKLKSGALRPGQAILVPRRDVALLARDVPNPSVEKYPSRRSAGGVGRHVVQRGETLGGIARKFGVSVPALMKLNGLKKDRVLAGQTLVVSGRASAAKGSAKVVKPGAKKPVAKSGASKPALKPGAKKPAANQPTVKKPAAEPAKP